MDMKKIGTLNIQLSRIIASLGHTDRLVICDSGLPIPRRKECVDLALAEGIPRFVEALQVVLEELQIEGAIIAEEMEARSNGLYERLCDMLPDVEIQRVPHERFKVLCGEEDTVAIVRTGEATPYANVILISGVTF